MSPDHEAGARRVGKLGSVIFTGSGKDNIQASRRFRAAFAEANTCDHALRLVAHANARVHRLYRERHSLFD